MASSTSFNRWKSISDSSWPWRVFKKHNIELMRMFSTFDNSKTFTYKQLGEHGAKWSDNPSDYFIFENPWEYDNFSDLKDWSNAFNELENWVNLNSLVTILSNLETYFSTIIPIALESDIGVLYGVPKKIDGIEIIKHGPEKPFDFSEIIESCTKGSWQSRSNVYKCIFKHLPNFFSTHISELDKMRISRNNVAHAFGRDIKKSRLKGKLTTLPISKIRRQTLIKFQNIVWKVCKEVDQHLMNSHIGEYEYLLFYHKLYPNLNKNVHPSMRAMDFKKAIGRFGSEPMSKKYSKGLVNYYESL